MQRPVIAFLVLVAFASVGLASVRYPQSGELMPAEPPADIGTLRPPATLTVGMTPFLDAVANNGNNLDKGRSQSIPGEQTAVWGYYAAILEEDPWKSMLVAQQKEEPGWVGWPPTPIHGPVLKEAEIQNRALELYISVRMLPNGEWASFQQGMLRSSLQATLRPEESACDLGTGCVLFVAQSPGGVPPHQEQRVWLWRHGRAVIAVTGMGAAGWPESLMQPLLQYYVEQLSQWPKVLEDVNGSARPPQLGSPVRSQ